MPALVGWRRAAVLAGYLLLMFGGRAAALVCAGMVLALVISYAVGRLVPARATASALACLGFERARDLVLRSQQMRTPQWLQLLSSRAPHRIVPFLIRHRYVALMLLFNLPGNSLAGGGGGIAPLAGLSRMFSFPRFAAAVAAAVAPVPLFFLLAG